MRNWPQDEKAIVIDTEEYSGNFEREMVAFVTGQVGECGKGQELADQAQDDLSPEVLHWFRENVVPTADEHGVLRPASISPTPGWYNDGKGNHYPDKKKGRNLYKNKKWPAYLSVEFVVDQWPDDHVMEVVLERVQEFCANYGTKYSLMAKFGEVGKPLTLTRVRWEERAVASSTVKRFQPPTEKTGWLYSTEPE